MLNRLKATIYYLFADHYQRTGQFGEAAACLTGVIERLPNNFAAYSDRGVAFQGMNDHWRAIDDLDRAIALNARLAIAYFNRGISWKCLGYFDRAVADQIQARALAPRHPGPHAELGVLSNIGRDFDAAIAHLSAAIKLARRNAGPYKSRGCSHFYRGDFAAAEADLRYSIRLAADDTYALLFWYLSCCKMGQVATDELDIHARALKDRQWPAAIIELYLGKIGVDAALAAATGDDDRAEAAFYIGEWHLMHGNRAEAATALQEAADSCPRGFLESMAAMVELERLAQA
jgi:lipoprotein NlpI